MATTLHMHNAIVNTIENTIVFVDWIAYEIHIKKQSYIQFDDTIEQTIVSKFVENFYD